MIQADLERRAPSPIAGSGLSAYFTEIGQAYCSYIQPSEKASALWISEYTSAELATIGDGSTEHGLLYVALMHAEWVRVRRERFVKDGNVAGAKLICDNVVVNDSSGLDWRSAKNLVDWPHYILKSLYTEVGLMFGKFWTQEQTEALDGRSIPPPPMTFISIRNAIRLRDPRLLQEQADLADLISAAEDDGHSILPQALGISETTREIDYQKLSAVGAYTILRNRLS